MSETFGLHTQVEIGSNESFDACLNLGMTAWLSSNEPVLIFPVCEDLIDMEEVLGYLVFEATGIKRKDLAAYRLVKMCSAMPEGRSVSTYQQAFPIHDPEVSAALFLRGICHGG